jgi:predicted O-linked N-acetylglucosamine transferase (SPINDLY family)
MNHTLLVATDVSEYVATAGRLLLDDVFLQEQQRSITEKFDNQQFHRNKEVAREWSQFLRTIVSSIQQ